MLPHKASALFKTKNFNEVQPKGFGGVRVYSNGSILLTAFLLTNECFLALPVSADLTMQSPSFKFDKEFHKLDEYLKQYGEVARRFRITLTTTA